MKKNKICFPPFIVNQKLPFVFIYLSKQFLLAIVKQYKSKKPHQTLLFWSANYNAIQGFKLMTQDDFFMTHVKWASFF